MMRAVRFINVLLAALLAGTSFGIWSGPDPAGFPAPAYVEYQQRLVASLSTLMVSLVVLATLASLGSAYVHRADRTALVLLLIAAGCFIACMLITRFGNVPLQDRIMTWDPNTVPADWQQVRDAWWRFHIQRTIAELVALAIVAWVSVHPARINLGT